MSGSESMRTIIYGRIRDSFMKDDELSDVTFIFGPGKVRVPGHKTLLAFCSPVFQAQFFGPLSRVNEEGQGPTTVEIPDIEPKIFINFMSFLYRDELTDGNEGTAEDYLDLLYPAHKYLVPSLSHLCVEKLRDKFELENVFQVYESAVLYGEDKLKKWSTEYMNRMSKKIIEMPQFVNLEAPMLSVFLQSDGLTASEQEIHRAVLRWAKAKVRRDGKKKSPESIRNALGHLIYLIRFPTMSEEEFRKEERVSVLRKDEIIDIYEQISCKDTSTDSQFGTKKRRLDCDLYLCHPNDYLKHIRVMHASKPPCRRIRFKLRADKRIFLKGVSLPSILHPYHFRNDSLQFQIELTVQVGDLPSVRTLSKVHGKVVEPEPAMQTSRKRPHGSPTSCPIRAIVLDELCEVPANHIVAICFEVFMTAVPGSKLEKYWDRLEVPSREEVQVDCLEDERKVNFQFFDSSDELRVYTWYDCPDILFTL